MKKIMFNDKYGLTAAVLRGEKTQTRRDATKLVDDYWNGRKLGDYPTLSLGEYVRQHAAYDVGDVFNLYYMTHHCHSYIEYLETTRPDMFGNKVDTHQFICEKYGITEDLKMNNFHFGNS